MVSKAAVRSTIIQIKWSLTDIKSVRHRQETIILSDELLAFLLVQLLLARSLNRITELRTSLFLRESALKPLLSSATPNCVFDSSLYQDCRPERIPSIWCSHLGIGPSSIVHPPDRHRCRHRRRRCRNRLAGAWRKQNRT